MLGKATGIFSLSESDNNVGSFLTIDDCATILNVPSSALEFLIRQMNGTDVIDENELFKAWYAGKIQHAPPCKINGASLSCDELILAEIIKNTFPNAIIEHQIKVGRYKMDLKVTHDNKSVFIEFDGPSHFAPTRWGIPSNHPFKKKEIVEHKTGIEVVNWAYWIQRCALNVQALFDTDVKGYGALWSTNCHFGMFVFDDSADIIKSINKRFNVEKNESIGYFYEEGASSRNKPEHPIIHQILGGKKSKTLLLPPNYGDKHYWLPASLILST
jgi:hypothetical protein